MKCLFFVLFLSTKQLFTSYYCFSYCFDYIAVKFWWIEFLIACICRTCLLFERKTEKPTNVSMLWSTELKALAKQCWMMQRYGKVTEEYVELWFKRCITVKHIGFIVHVGIRSNIFLELLIETINILIFTLLLWYMLTLQIVIHIHDFHIIN